MITSMRGCVARNDPWTWSISSRSFSCDFAIKLQKYITSCHVCLTAQTVLARCLFHGLHIYGTITTHEGTMCRVPFPGQWVKGQGHTGRSHFCGRGGGILVDHRTTISSNRHHHQQHHHHRRRRYHHYHYHYYHCCCALLNPMILWLLEWVSTSIRNIPGQTAYYIDFKHGTCVCIQVEPHQDWLTHCGQVMSYGGIYLGQSWLM